MNHKPLQSFLSLFSVALLLITLGAAFGVLAGRGPLIGMLSTCILVLVTALVGGTRHGISSLTGPMTAAVAVVFASDQAWLTTHVSEATATEMLGLTVLASGLILFILKLLRVDKIVSFIPNLVISGFMNGIAILIILSQVKSIGSSTDLILGVISFLTAFLISRSKNWGNHPIFKLLSSSFLVILAITLLVHALDIPATLLSLDGQGLADIFPLHTPMISPALMWIVLPLGLELAVIALLDTLLTGVIMEKESKEKTQFGRELTGQSLAMVLTGLIAGVPGAQSTVPSMMFLKEDIKLPWAKFILALLVIAMTFLLLEWVEYVPTAVLAGFIFKIAYDVADLTALTSMWKSKDKAQAFFLFGTVASTVLISLNLAVIGFTCLFVFWNKIMPKRYRIPDLKPINESEGFTDEL